MQFLTFLTTRYLGILSLLALVWFAALPSVAQLKAVDKDDGYSYWVHTPMSEGEESSKMPVLVFLHGRSLSGNDLNRVKRYGVLRAMERGRELEAIVVAPQTSSGWDADRVMAMVDEVIVNHDADARRVYVCGMSMGGYGTMDVAGKYPDRIAAAVAICGGGTLSFACDLGKVPLWIYHGSSDRIVPPSESKKIYQAIKSCNPNADAKLTIIPGGTHGSVERLFHDNEIYEWMFQYSLD